MGFYLDIDEQFTWFAENFVRANINNTAHNNNADNIQRVIKSGEYFLTVSR